MFKKLFFVYAALTSCLFNFAQEVDSTQIIKQQLDSLEASFTYQHGTVQLLNGVGAIKVPDGFKYLDAKQAEQVLVDIWGNMPGEGLTLGLLLPEHQGVLDDTGYVFNIQYDEIGYVKDNDADDIDYNELLADMKKGATEENVERVKQGYGAIHIVGWAAPPFYDKDKKVLHWAKEIKFGESEVNTLNYNIRVLGRKGVIVLNAIASMPNMDLAKKDVDKVLDIVQYNEGYAYKDFNPDVDEVAAWTIGGLVAGKVLAKAGILAMLLKAWKFIALGVAGIGSFVFKRFRKNKTEEPALEDNTPVAEAGEQQA